MSDPFLIEEQPDPLGDKAHDPAGLPLPDMCGWTVCKHLEGIKADQACTCGYRGGIGHSDGEHTICEMGVTIDPEWPGMEIPPVPRPQEIANAHLISAAPDLLRGALMAREAGDFSVLNWAISKATAGRL